MELRSLALAPAGAAPVDEDDRVREAQSLRHLSDGGLLPGVAHGPRPASSMRERLS